MGKDSKIVWCEHSWNPWIGCTKLTGREGCRNCYAAAQAKVHGWNNWGDGNPRRITSDDNWDQPRKWNKAASKGGPMPRVFVMSLGDFLEDRPELVEPRKRAVDVMSKAPFLEWLILTKRIDNWEMVDWGAIPNKRLGITVECQEAADRDVPKLLATGLPNFVSVEPQIERVDFSEWLFCDDCRHGPYGRGVVEDLLSNACGGKPWSTCHCHYTRKGLDWIICGAESRGPYAGRPFNDDWARLLRDQCVDAGVPFMFKQGHADGRVVHCELCGGILEPVEGEL